MSDQKTIYIHIGLQKTGTTTIQNFFSQNRETLISYNLLYPNSGIAYRTKHTKLINDLNSDEFKEKGISNTWDSLVREVNDSNVSNILISDEAFNSHLKPEQIEWMYNKLNDFNVKIILYLRDPTDFLFSFYKFGIRFGIYYPFSKYLEKELSRCNFEAIIQKWGKVFGQDNLIIKIYELSKKKSLLVDFLDLMIVSDSNLTEKAISFQPKNSSSSVHQLKAMLVINTIARSVPFILGFKNREEIEKNDNNANLIKFTKKKIALRWFLFFNEVHRKIKRNTNSGNLVKWIVFPFTLFYRINHQKDDTKIRDYFNSLEKPLMINYLLSQLSEEEIQQIKWLSQSVSIKNGN